MPPGTFTKYGPYSVALRREACQLAGLSHRAYLLLPTAERDAGRDVARISLKKKGWLPLSKAPRETKPRGINLNTPLMNSLREERKAKYRPLDEEERKDRNGPGWAYGIHHRNNLTATKIGSSKDVKSRLSSLNGGHDDGGLMVAWVLFFLHRKDAEEAIRAMAYAAGHEKLYGEWVRIHPNDAFRLGSTHQNRRLP